MPNTFVHLGIQTLSSRAVLKGSDFKWIAIGCIIPDFPWIVQRIVGMANTGADRYDLLNYFSAQASLFSCMILSGALAVIVWGGGRIFLLLAANSLLHLLIDAVQIKWANGVYLLAPFSWQLTGFNLIWPEHFLIYMLTFLGVLVLLYYGFRDWRKPVILVRSKARYVFSALLLLLYVTAPFLSGAALVNADNRFSTTLRNINERPGKYLELDRHHYRSRDNTVLIFNGERVTVQGVVPEQDAKVSVKGYFVDANIIHISELHVHSPMRDISSIVALAGVLFVWCLALVGKRVTFFKLS